MMSADAYEHSLMRQFIMLFPASPMASLLRGYYNYMGVSISEDEDEDDPTGLPDDDPFDTILVSMVSKKSQFLC
jgi:superkiller protein 3